ncbi:MAG: sodium:calcium antiporter [Chitinophagaceae bacterium]|nr:sodium:calcium antiporter [Chitinophagaceae bacterium]
MLFVAGFLLCAVIIFFAGKKLSRYGDMLSEKTGLSKGWVGLILMASVTSLPELMVGISSSAIVQSADLAVGDILGSCAFNLGILAMLDAFVPMRRPLLGVASPSHMLNAGLGIILLTLVGFAFFLSDYALTPWLAVSSLTFVVVYLIAVRIIYQNEKNHKEEGNNNIISEKVRNTTLRIIILNYSIFAGIIIVAALSLPYFAEHIAEITGLGKSFVGTFFLAASTSLPEIAVSIAAVRIGSVDLSVGNLLGSNIFNILILALDDMVYTKGFILQDASDFHLLSVLSTIVMSAIVIIGLSYRAKGKRFWLAWDAAIIFIVYILNLILLYRFTS